MAKHGGAPEAFTRGDILHEATIQCSTHQLFRHVINQLHDEYNGMCTGVLDNQSVKVAIRMLGP